MKVNRLIFLLFSISFLFKSVTHSQSICLGVDKVLCPGQSITINDCGNIGGGGGGTSAPYTISTIPYNPDSYNAGTPVTLSDDSQTGLINIGFNFCFFGQTYTQFIIAANNWIGFSTNQTGTWITNPIPSTGTVPRNTIMGPWQDINPGSGGSVRYQLLGTAPNRRLVVSWFNVPMFSCTGQLYSSQIKIFETTNNIETHILNKQICSTWNDGEAVHGLHNATGTVAVVVPGRNNTQWATTNEGKLFTPGSWGVTWGNTVGQTFPYNNGSLTVTTVPANPTGYFLKSGCGSGPGTAISDTTWLSVANPSVTLSAVNDVCSQGIGSVTATAGNGSPAPITYTWASTASTWSPPASNTNVLPNLTSGNYSVTIVDGNICSATQSINVGDNPASFSISSTLVSCPGGNDGTATAVVTPSSVLDTYQWSDGQTTQTAIDLAEGTYSCTVTSNSGCSGTVTATVTEIPAMQLTITNLQDADCYTIANGDATISVTQGTAPYSFSWSQSSSTTNTANDLAAGPHTLTVTDFNGCVDDTTFNIDQPNPIVITSITPDTQICPEDDITLSVTATGGSSPYTYSWNSNGNLIGSASSVTVQPTNSSTTYCVTVGETCGSPTDQACVVISHPTPIYPNLEPDEIIKCTPGEFIFSNTSTNQTEIQTTTYAFSNGQSFTINSNQGFSNGFPIPGNYNVNIATTSIYGCIYDTTLNDIIVVVPAPVADFTIAKNPVTWFETTVQTSDNSTGTVTEWNWVSPGAISITNGSPTGILQYSEGVTGTYPITLIVTSQLGCSDSVTLNVEVAPDVLLYVPNAFTPDADEHNQQWFFYIEGVDLENFQVEIYNRWGEVIWVSYDAKERWDGMYNGSPIQAGTYLWKISYKEINSDGRKFHTGYINILR